jgi:hypothetical protein
MSFCGRWRPWHPKGQPSEMCALRKHSTTNNSELIEFYLSVLNLSQMESKTSAIFIFINQLGMSGCLFD